MNICFRCKGPLGKKHENFLDRKYHPPCAVMSRYFYQTHIREFEDLSIEGINRYLDLRIEMSSEEYNRRRTNEQANITRTLRDDKG